MSQKRRPALVVGNWKMHKTIAESILFIQELTSCIQEADRVWIAVPFTAIHASAQAAAGSFLEIGAQNVYDQESGAFTGEISCAMLKEAGASFVIVGHSERRQLFQESSSLVNKKAKRALACGLTPLICIGETLEQHTNGSAHRVLELQLQQSLEGFTQQELSKLVLSYEPIWAIGTHHAAPPELAQSTHQFCRDFLASHWTRQCAQDVCILYGGSVKPENAFKLFEQPDIDGVLVGGSSLSVDAFEKIIKSRNINIS